MNKKSPIIIYIIIGLLIGYFGRGLIGRGFDDGWQAARQKLLADSAEETDKNILTGVVQEVQDKQIIIRTSLLTPLDGRELGNRTVKVNKDTVIMAKRLKTEREMLGDENAARLTDLEEQRRQARSDNDQAKAEDIRQQILDLRNEASSQDSYTYSPISLADIKVGQSIVIRADQDISQKTKFTAESLEVSD